MSVVFTWLGGLLVVTGLVFFIGAAVGLMRFPDFYTRMHAAGKGDTLCSLLIVLGVAIALLGEVDWSHFHWSHTLPQLLVPLKLLAICVFIMISSPASTHALMDAGFDDGIEPVTGEGGNALADDGLHATAGEPRDSAPAQKGGEEKK